MRLTCFIALLFPLSAAAQETARSEPIPLSELYPPLPGIEYYCTDSTGARVELGQILCFTASCQTWMARCEMTASNRMAMWRKLQDGCPAASVERSPITRLKALKNAL